MNVHSVATVVISLVDVISDVAVVFARSDADVEVIADAKGLAMNVDVGAAWVSIEKNMQSNNSKP